MPDPPKQNSRSEKRKLKLTKAELETEETKKPSKTRRSGRKSSGMEPPKIQTPGQKTRIGSFRTEINESLSEKKKHFTLTYRSWSKKGRFLFAPKKHGKRKRT